MIVINDKRFEIPVSCGRCIFSMQRRVELGSTLYCFFIGDVGCTIDDTNDILNKRHPNCPLGDVSTDTDVRTIDANALLHELNNCRYPGAPYIDAGISIEIGKVCDAPTIKAREVHEVTDSDTVSRQQAIDAICDDWCGYTNANCPYGSETEHYCDGCDAICILKTLPQIIAGLPSVQPQPEQNGYWRHYEGYLTCSECGAEYYDDIMEYCGDGVPKFCPNCGADMRGGAV